MNKHIYDENLKIAVPTLLIERKDHTAIGAVKASDIIYKNNFNSPNELSFTVYPNDMDSFLWDSVNDYHVICIPEYNEYFDMQVTLTEENNISKQVTCTALGEAELSQINLYEIEINTAADIARDAYDPDYPTVFYRNLAGYEPESAMYRKLYNASLLHRILDKASNYSIGHVDESLKNLKDWYQFSISNTTIYDELMGEIAQQYKCLFVIDPQNRTVNAYDLCNTCHTCGYRGEFSDKCPVCGEKENFDGAYGKDTAIFISKDNLSTSASIASNKDSLKNCFYVSGGDDMITESIRNINPNGSNYIYYFSPETKESMPKELVDKIDTYTSYYDFSYHEKSFALHQSQVNDYNNVINDINHWFPQKDENSDITNNRYEPISSDITGYKNIIRTLYDNIDIGLFLQSSMFPTIVTENETLEESLSKLNAANLSPIGVSDIKTAALSSIDRAVENYCRVFINTSLYKISTENTNFSYVSGHTEGTWTGTVTLTEIADKEISGSVTLSLKVNSDLENFLKQKLKKELRKMDNYAKSIIDLDLEDNPFKNKLHLYNADYLLNIQQAFTSCLTVISETAKTNAELYQNFYGLYSKRLSYIASEINLRDTQIKIVTRIFEMLRTIQLQEQENLNFRSYLGKDLWKVFCSYRREDSYQNTNYISDNLTNSEIIDKTEELLDAAKKELFKAGNMQFDVTANLNNLLALPEFYSLSDDFEVGNWIHLMVNETVYPLRLLSYELHFDDLATIPVEFSTLVKTSDGTSDLKSVIDSAVSIAGSYPSFKQQMKSNTAASEYVKDWVQNGLDATNTKLVNDTLTQDIVIDSNGILCRAFDDIENDYDRHQIKINRNALYFTNDDWNSIYSAIGKYYYTDPITKKEKTAYGVIAESIVGKFILGENLGIYNNESESSLSFDANGLMVTNGKNSFIVNPNADNNTGLLQILKGDNKQFYINSNGDVCLSGSINIGNGNFHVDTFGNIVSKGTINLANGGITYNPTDGLNITGKITATNGTFNGTVNATGGTFSNTITCNGTISGGTLSGSSISGGSINIGNHNFTVNTSGALSAKNAAITGTVNATTMKAKGSYYICDNDFDEYIKVISSSTDNTSDTKYNFGRLTNNGYGSGLNYIYFKDESDFRSCTIITDDFTAPGIAYTSDERLKNSFEYLDAFDDAYMDLKPFRFKYNNGRTGRFHFGFGAKETKQILEKHGFTTNDFAGFVQKTMPEGNEEYSGLTDPMFLRYSEFIAWNTHMIQKLYKENETLKQRILKLEQAMV